MVALLVALVVITLLAGVVLAYVAGPARGREIRGLSEVVDRVGRYLPDDEPAPAYGVLSDPERDEQLRERFERAEQSVQRVMAPLTQEVRLERRRQRRVEAAAVREARAAARAARQTEASAARAARAQAAQAQAAQAQAAQAQAAQAQAAQAQTAQAQAAGAEVPAGGRTAEQAAPRARISAGPPRHRG